MLADVDSSLSAWLTASLPPRTEIGFGSPAEVAAAKPRRHPLVNLFLYSVDEDTSGLAAADVRVRDETGRVSSAALPARRYALTYLVTAWAGDPVAEHGLLGAVLAAHAAQEVLDRRCLRGSLAQVDAVVPMHIGAPLRPPVWQELRVPVRTGLELTVIAPVFAPRAAVLAPAAENLELVARSVPARPAPPAGPQRRWRRTSLTEP